MLVDVKPNRVDSQMASIMRALGGGPGTIVRHAKGVYECGGGNFDHEIGLDQQRPYEDQYPDLTRRIETTLVMSNTSSVEGGDAYRIRGGNTGDYFGCYGVCDSWQQVVEQCAQLQDTDSVSYCLSVSPVLRSKQSSEGGWRWHKWGEYIGTQQPTAEYIYDEPLIELVFCYHIYKLPAEMVTDYSQGLPYNSRFENAPQLQG